MLVQKCRLGKGGEEKRKGESHINSKQHLNNNIQMKVIVPNVFKTKISDLRFRHLYRRGVLPLEMSVEKDPVLPVALEIEAAVL